MELAGAYLFKVEGNKETLVFSSAQFHEVEERYNEEIGKLEEIGKIGFRVVYADGRPGREDFGAIAHATRRDADRRAAKTPSERAAEIARLSREVAAGGVLAASLEAQIEDLSGRLKKKKAAMEKDLAAIAKLETAPDGPVTKKVKKSNTRAAKADEKSQTPPADEPTI